MNLALKQSINKNLVVRAGVKKVVGFQGKLTEKTRVSWSERNVLIKKSQPENSYSLQ